MKNHLLTLALIATTWSHAAVTTKTIEYKDGAQTLEGVLVSPDKMNKTTPIIVMVHNWMGITEETKIQATRYADLGYQVFEADIYGKGIRPTDAKQAGEMAGTYKKDRTLFRKRLNLALQAALEQPQVDAKRVAVLGYCFGGTGALELARSGAKLNAVVTFHGGLDSPTPSDGKNIKSELLILHGKDDPYVPAKDIAAFESELKSNHVKYTMIQYPGAVHSFTDRGAGNDNSKGAAYNAEADAKSYAEAKAFLAKKLK